MEYDIVIKSLIGTSPLAAILFAFTYKLWDAYQKELAYNKERDIKNLEVYMNMASIMDGVSKLLTQTNTDLGRLSEKTGDIQNNITRITERQAENNAMIVKINDFVMDIGNEIKYNRDSTKSSRV